MEINGIQVGMFGYRIWDDSAFNKNRIRAAIEDLQNRGAQLIIAYYHWGVEGENRPEQYQINIGRYSIRNGADLVLGAHPHVVQGIEEYMGRFIVYSLANFCFGGNSNPADQDSFIFQQTFTFYHGELQPDIDKNIIPIFVSSVRYRNDFVPTIAEGADAERILARIERYSQWP
jgi:poly-gamma-glutamate synthesis protein (capsule biosynthesis protein)